MRGNPLHALAGPAVGAALYDVGGFMLPFLVVGAVSTALSLCLILTIPTVDRHHLGTQHSVNGDIPSGEGIANDDAQRLQLNQQHRPTLRCSDVQGT